MALTGHKILLVEDEPLIALDIAEGLQAAGASVLTAYTLRDGLRFVSEPDLSAAILDFGLSDGEAQALCERLDERRVPFILHTGYAKADVQCGSGVVVSKPATPQELVSTVQKLLQI
jgi:DNA-binding response OmpR family regulator